MERDGVYRGPPIIGFGGKAQNPRKMGPPKKTFGIFGRIFLLIAGKILGDL